MPVLFIILRKFFQIKHQELYRGYQTYTRKEWYGTRKTPYKWYRWYNYNQARRSVKKATSGLRIVTLVENHPEVSISTDPAKSQAKGITRKTNATTFTRTKTIWLFVAACQDSGGGEFDEKGKPRPRGRTRPIRPIKAPVRWSHGYLPIWSHITPQRGPGWRWAWTF